MSMSDESFLTSYPQSVLPQSRSFAWPGPEPSTLQCAWLIICRLLLCQQMGQGLRCSIAAHSQARQPLT